MRKIYQITSTFGENPKIKYSSPDIGNKQATYKSDRSNSANNTLDLTDEMIGLLAKAGAHLENSLDNVNYQINIIHQLQEDMNKRPEKYSKNDAKVYNKMKKQLKDDPIFTKIDDANIDEKSIDYLMISGDLSRLTLKLSSMDIGSEESYNKYIQFYKERTSSGAD